MPRGVNRRLAYIFVDLLVRGERGLGLNVRRELELRYPSHAEWIDRQINSAVKCQRCDS